MASNNFYGYTLLTLPSGSVKPGSVLILEKNKTAKTTNFSITGMFENNTVAFPLRQEDNLPAGLQQTLTLHKSIETEVSFLQTLLKLAGASLTASFSSRKDAEVSVQLQDAAKEYLDEYLLDSFLFSSNIKGEGSSFIASLKDKKLFVVSDIIKCKGFHITEVSAKNTEAGAGADIPQAGSIEAGFEKENKKESEILHTGNTYLTIGVKAYRIFYKKKILEKKGAFRLRLQDELEVVKGIKKKGFPGEMMGGGVTFK